MADTDQTDFTTLTVDLLSAYFANNTVDSAALPGLIRSTHDALKQIDGGTPEAAAEPEYKPAVSIRKSTASSDFLISLVDGKQYKTLKRHLKSNGLTPQQYRERYGLPRDYPMVAPAFAEARRVIAAKIGLGRKPKPDAAAASDAATATTAAVPSTATSPAEAPAPAKKAAAKPRTAARAATPAMAKSAVAKSKAAPAPSAPTPPAEPVAAEPVAAAIAKTVAKKAPAAKTPAKAKAAPVETPSIEGKPAKAPKAKPIAATKAPAKRTPKPKAATPAPTAAES